MMDEHYIYGKESYRIVGAAMEVHKVLGCGFTEPIYQEALEKELQLQKIPYEREKIFNVTYKGMNLAKTFRVDFVCFNKIIVELKAVSDFSNEHYSQVYNYLKASGLQLGILFNFGNSSLQYERIPCQHKWL
ncbi:MAG: GxxExxY protein [Bacteroidaceae bacterium]|nr:GxxExxY protein [Bacteroidaceae bacterium]